MLKLYHNSDIVFRINTIKGFAHWKRLTGQLFMAYSHSSQVLSQLSLLSTLAHIGRIRALAG